jgi:hypothetical protein
MERSALDVMAAVTWEEAKGKLRALVAVHGCGGGGVGSEAAFTALRDKVEAFIREIEADGLHHV